MSHVSRGGAKLGVGFYHLVHCIEKVFLSGNLQMQESSFHHKIKTINNPCTVY